MVSNMTLVTIGMREGIKCNEKTPIVVKTPRLKKHRSLMARLVHFIETTTQELEASNAKLKQLAQIDRLTGLYNRGETELRLRHMMELQESHEHPLAVLMMDVDDFKGINDNFGHATGDATLKAIADVLRASTCGEDAPGRWGGDEFFVVFHDMEQKRLKEVAEHIRQQVASLDVLANGNKVTTSIGGAVARPDDTVDSLCRRVDRALYAAKRAAGKDTVIMM